MIELTVIVKGEDATFKKKHLVYEDIMMAHDDPMIEALIKDAIEASKIVPERITIKTLMVVQ